MGGLGVCVWVIIALLPWKPWSTQERFEKTDSPLSRDLSSVTVLIPARNEADTIGQTIESLNHQGADLNIILVDDQSTDETSEVARKAAANVRLTVIRGSDLPAGWAGKLWALQQGLSHITTPNILLLDADIELKPNVIPALLRKMEREGFDLVSIMAHLRMKSFFEQMLIPAFIYFFKLLYPFALGNATQSKLGVAAGGFVLVKRDALTQVEAFNSIRGALIDDCSLAQKLKSNGFRTWIGLSREVLSHRGYDSLSEIWNMVARSAFTQLRYSLVLLLGATFIMTSMYIAPWASLILSGHSDFALFSALGIALMTALYLPTLLFYSMNPLWAFTMPLIAALYLAMTWTSAIRYWRGKRSQWKNRVYGKESADAA